MTTELNTIMVSGVTYPASLLCDFYKISHRTQYPVGTEKVYSTFTPRTSCMQNVDEVVFFGLQGFVMEYLIEYFDACFFSRPVDDVVREYERIVKFALGVTEPDSQHIRDLHAVGFLPIEICAVPEGTRVPLRCPMLTIENTDPRFAWLTNYLETLMSLELWHPCTTATIANQYRLIMETFARRTGSDPGFTQFQGHDFSMRGMTSVSQAAKGGVGHLLAFVGTDTIPAICHAEKYYYANVENELVGCSVPATEHSVMCSYGKENEMEGYRRLMTEVYPSGILSIVSDTWDFWKVLTEIIAGLKSTIMARDGKIVIRPDSGDPVKIICGDPESDNPLAKKGALEILWEIFGGKVNGAGFRELDPHIGLIYGDAITLDVCDRMLYTMMKKKFAASNIVLGIGSYTYQHVTRDTFGFAVKSTCVTINGQEKAIFKDPVTDSGVKKSAVGRVVVQRGGTGRIMWKDGLTRAEVDASGDDNLLQPVFKDGEILREQNLAEIRELIRKTNWMTTKKKK